MARKRTPPASITTHAFLYISLIIHYYNSPISTYFLPAPPRFHRTAHRRLSHSSLPSPASLLPAALSSYLHTSLPPHTSLRPHSHHPRLRRTVHASHSTRSCAHVLPRRIAARSPIRGATTRTTANENANERGQKRRCAKGSRCKCSDESAGTRRTSSLARSVSRNIPSPTTAQLVLGFLTATASEDWTLVLDVCDHASSSENAAKEAVRALRREFKYGEPAAQLAAARVRALVRSDSSANQLKAMGHHAPQLLTVIRQAMHVSQVSRHARGSPKIKNYCSCCSRTADCRPCRSVLRK